MVIKDCLFDFWELNIFSNTICYTVCKEGNYQDNSSDNKDNIVLNSIFVIVNFFLAIISSISFVSIACILLAHTMVVAAVRSVSEGIARNIGWIKNDSVNISLAFVSVKNKVSLLFSRPFNNQRLQGFRSFTLFWNELLESFVIYVSF